MIPDRIEVAIAGGLNIPLPRMAYVRQKFEATCLGDIGTTVHAQFQRPEIRAKVRTGQSIAVGCGSRGVANIALIARATVRELLALGAKPFVFPCMGSHGAATAEGQKKVLESYGITETYLDVPINATMDTTIVGQLDDGTPVHMDQYAAAAEGIVVINRIKPHTGFRGPTESGLTKMLAIGIGKITGAATYHSHGMDTFPELLPRIRDINISKRPVLFGVGIVENAYDETAVIELVLAEQLATREPVLQALAKSMMPQLPFDNIDVLVIDEMGKNISGAGFDPNITGRNRRVIKWDPKPLVRKIVVLGLTPQSGGNATGMGGADIITMRLYKDFDVASTYANIITSMNLDGAAIPMIMNTDREAIQLAAKTLVQTKPQDARIVRIKNTLHISEIQVSEPLLEEVKAKPDQLSILTTPQPFIFDGDGRLSPLAAHPSQAAA